MEGEEGADQQDDLTLHEKKQLKAAALHAWFTSRPG